MKDYYYLLGVERTASKTEIKKAYRKLTTKFHSDKNKDDDGYFAKRFLDVQEAYETLIDTDKRAKYDKKLNTSNTKFEADKLSAYPLPIRVALENVIDDEALGNLAHYLEIQKDIEWEKILSNWIFNIKDEKNVGNPVKVVAMIESISSPDPMDLQGEDRVSVYSISLMDLRGNKIICLNTSSDLFKNEISVIFEKQSYHVFCGTVVSITGTKPVYRFYLDKIEHNVTPEDLIVVRPEPSQELYSNNLSLSKSNDKLSVTEKYKKIVSQEQGSLIKYIKKTVVKELGIKGLESATELNKCIDFMILQGFSFGKDGNNSLRLHSLVIGSPGVGKKFLTLIAKILNPLTVEIQSVSGKISMAGLIGNVTTKKGRKYSNPGYFAKASTAVVCVQDFHEIKGSTRQQFLAILSKVMEDGEVEDNTSAQTTHEAVTAIHLDTNTYPQVRLTESSNPMEALKIPTNILSRFDFIMYIERDAERQYNVITDFLKKEKTILSYTGSSEEKQWLRELRRIVAHVRTEFQKVIISENVNQYIKDKLDQFKLDNKDSFKNSKLMSDIIMRLGMSIHKYVKAITTANRRHHANEKDVDYALTFIEEKLKYLSQIEHIGVTNFREDSLKLNSEERYALVRESFPGKIVDGKMVFEFYENKSIKVSRKTVKRDLDDHAKNIKHNQWEIK